MCVREREKERERERERERENERVRGRRTAEFTHGLTFDVPSFIALYSKQMM